jgi:hypothetical protein
VGGNVIDSDKAILLECFIRHGMFQNWSCTCEDSSPTLKSLYGGAFVLDQDLADLRAFIKAWPTPGTSFDVYDLATAALNSMPSTQPNPPWALDKLREIKQNSLGGPATFGPFVDESKPTWSGTVYMKPYCMNCKVDLSSYLDAYYGPTKTLANFCSKCRPEYQRLLTTGRKNGTKRA